MVKHTYRKYFFKSKIKANCFTMSLGGNYDRIF